MRMSASIEGDGSPWRALNREAILSSSCFNRITLATVENRLRMGVGVGRGAENVVVRKPFR